MNPAQTQQGAPHQGEYIQNNPAPPTYNTHPNLGSNEKSTLPPQEMGQMHPDQQQQPQFPTQPQPSYQSNNSFPPSQQSQPQTPMPMQQQNGAGGGGYKYQMATPLGSLQQGPSPVDCPICGVREMTRCEFVPGGTTHLSAILLCCCLCLGCIPYIGNWLKDCEHKCGHCGALLAIWHRSGRTEVIAHR